MTEFATELANCPHCGARRPLREVPQLTSSRVPGWLRSAYRRMQLGAAKKVLSDDETRRRVAQYQEQFPSLTVDDLAVVCCFFNPCGYRSRSENYRRFAEAMSASKVKLLTVELAIGDADHELPEIYGELHRVRSDSVLWHKERLLNIGIQRLLGDDYRQIVWLDADVEFRAKQDWPWFVAAALRESALCQVFSTLVADSGARPVPAISAVEYFRRTGEKVNQATRPPSLSALSGIAMGMPGYGWAARSDLLSECLLYDRAIVGGGDKLIFAASAFASQSSSLANPSEAMSEFSESPFASCPNCSEGRLRATGFLDDLSHWSSQWQAAGGTDPAMADLALEVMFHGTWTDRSYWLRQDILARTEYDPASDLTLNEDGCWEWASDKSELHSWVARYFRSRNEDVGR